jgi:hypothetical protein
VPEYEITVERDGRFLMVRVPALDGLTQARFPSEVESQAGDYIATVTETPIEDITVRVLDTVPTFSTAEYETACADLVAHVHELRDRLKTHGLDADV